MCTCFGGRKDKPKFLVGHGILRKNTKRGTEFRTVPGSEMVQKSGVGCERASGLAESGIYDN